MPYQRLIHQLQLTVHVFKTRRMSSVILVLWICFTVVVATRVLEGRESSTVAQYLGSMLRLHVPLTAIALQGVVN
jgi:hypothetical protein